MNNKMDKKSNQTLHKSHKETKIQSRNLLKMVLQCCQFP